MLNLLRSIKEKVLCDGIYAAIRKNNLEELRLLLSKEKAKKLVRNTGGTVLGRGLTLATVRGYLGCMEELLKAGADPGERDSYNEAMFMGESQFMKLLLDYGAKPDCGEDLPLCLAARLAEPGIFRTLLLYGADPDYNGTSREVLQGHIESHSVLGMCLSKNYEVPFVEMLTEFGANMYLPDIQEILLHADNEAAKFLDRKRVHPRSLMSQCRIAIRRRLKQVGKLRLLDQLEIPTNLVRYLQYHNELDYPDTLPRYHDEIAKEIYDRFFHGVALETPPPSI
ncbi:ankyrin repeat and SOCS box protein 12-like [Leptodactylus fuscus]|uniref:ankyrin repeat and SOCS box protein 12-like n=1 Tax=Leptodactylus fuscus TaxID=238119 RepID=UPI003F4F2B1F